ncbi:MAG: Clp protease N-terminal domain-containing protein [Terracidiphilus sp.]
MVLAYAAQEADGNRQYWIDTDHLLLGLLRFPNEASPALAAIPLNLDSVRAASRRHREKFPPAPAPSTSVVRVIFETLKPPLIMLGWITLFGLVMTLIIRWLNY